MKHKKIFLLLTFGIISGCSNIQQEEALSAQSDKINAQTAELSAQADKINAQTAKLSTQDDKISVQSDKINAQIAELNVQSDKINTQKAELSAKDNELNSLKLQLKEADKSNEYIVKKGDTLSKISRENKISLNTLKKLNPSLEGKGADLIYPGLAITLN